MGRRFRSGRGSRVDRRCRKRARGHLESAEEARLSFNAAGESALAARFPSPEFAARAVGAYGAFFAFGDARRDDAGGLTARRHGGQSVEWRYADARWIDHARDRRLLRVHRLVFSLDANARTGRVREYWGRLDASDGVDGVRVEWKQWTGIQFFHRERHRVIGVQLDAGGRPNGALAGGYDFDLQNLKAPLITAVVDSGWTWQPLVWDPPPALRWATE